MSSVPLRLPTDGVFEGDWSSLTWWLSTHRSSELHPERRLLWAVLEDAVACLRRPLRPLRPLPRGAPYSHEFGFAVQDRARARQEARLWVASRDQVWPYAFENVCAYLGLAPDWVRRQIALLPPQTGGSGRPKVRSEATDRLTAGIARTRGEAAGRRGTRWTTLNRGAG